MKYQVTKHNRSLGEYYKRFSGSIVASDGSTMYFEYGEYPYPATDENGEEYEGLEFRFGVITSDGFELLQVEAVELLRDAGVLNTEHVGFLKERFAGFDGIEVL